MSVSAHECPGDSQDLWPAPTIWWRRASRCNRGRHCAPNDVEVLRVYWVLSAGSLRMTVLKAESSSYCDCDFQAGKCSNIERLGA